jgi:hypothetical protein
MKAIEDNLLLMLREAHIKALKDIEKELKRRNLL